MATTTKKDQGSGVEQAATEIKDKAQQAAGTVADTAKSAASAAAEQADKAAGAVGSGARNLADTVRHNTPNEGVMGSASNAVADSLESAGKYLEEQGLSGMTEDLANVVRRYPLPAFLVGVGLGFMLARVTSSS